MDGLKSARAIAVHCGAAAAARWPPARRVRRGASKNCSSGRRTLARRHTACAAVSAFTELFSLVLNAVRDRRAVFRLFVLPKFLSN